MTSVKRKEWKELRSILVNHCANECHDECASCETIDMELDAVKGWIDSNRQFLDWLADSEID